MNPYFDINQRYGFIIDMISPISVFKSVSFSMQHHHGHPPQQIWVFGMVDASQSPGLGYMEIVQRRDACTLLPIIQAHCAPGTTVHSDEWASYNAVGNIANIGQHGVVNHSLHFVDPMTGVHTQTVESYWNRVKTKLKRMKGCAAHQLASYLDEFMWRERHGRTASEALQNIMRDISTQYPV